MKDKLNEISKVWGKLYIIMLNVTFWMIALGLALGDLKGQDLVFKHAGKTTGILLFATMAIIVICYVVIIPIRKSIKNKKMKKEMHVGLN